MLNLNTEIIGQLPIYIVSLLEQTAIADLLTTWDSAIKKTRTLIQAKEKRFKWLLKRLIRDQAGNPGWRKVRLGEVAEIRMGTSPPSSAYNDNLLGLPLLQGKADLFNRLSSPRIYTNEITQECFIGDLLLTVRAPVGYISRAIHHCCIGRGIASISVKNDFD